MKAEPRPLSPLLIGANVVVTAAVHHKMEGNPAFSQEVAITIFRFQSLDWGDTCREDRKTNEESLRTGDRLFAVYNTTGGRIYVIADAVDPGQPYRLITVLFPSDY